MHVPELQPPGVRGRSSTTGDNIIINHHPTTLSHSSTSAQSSSQQQQQLLQQGPWESHNSYLSHTDDTRTGGPYQQQQQQQPRQQPLPQQTPMGPGSFSQPYYAADVGHEPSTALDYPRWVELYNQQQQQYQSNQYYQQHHDYHNGGYDQHSDAASYGGETATGSSRGFFVPSTSTLHDSLAPPPMVGLSSSEVSSDGTQAHGTPSSDIAALPRSSTSPTSVSFSSDYPTTSPSGPKTSTTKASSSAVRKRRKPNADAEDSDGEPLSAYPLTASVGTEYTAARLYVAFPIFRP
jgi:hypothetical protein